MGAFNVSTIGSPEFINLQPSDINPLMMECEVKVLYLGGNRNHSNITKSVANEMAKTLRGVPIAGYYKEEKEDYTDHGEVITMDADGLKFEKKTMPYGFVSPDAKVWFQKFSEDDEFGNTFEREYLMTNGYLWTKVLKEANLIFEDNGRPQSMELDEETLEGKWTIDKNSNIEFFIINDAIFSQLCILGEDVEPCFEGASVTAPNVSASFALNNGAEFKQSLFTMMQELTQTLKGEKSMANKEVKEVLGTETDFANKSDKEKDKEKTANNAKDNKDKEKEEKPKEEDKKDSEPKEKEEKEEKPEDKPKEADPKEDDKAAAAPKEKEKEEEKPAEDKKEGEDKKKKTYSLEEYSALETELSELKASYTALESANAELVEFKKAVEDKEKDAKIKEFYMLSDDLKKDIIENKANYSLDEIESKLCVLCVKNKVNFEQDNTSKNDKEVEKEVTTTFNLNNSADDSAPAWVKAARNIKNSKNI